MMTVRRPKRSAMTPDRTAPAIMPNIPEERMALRSKSLRLQSFLISAMTPLTMPWSMASNSQPMPTASRTTAALRVIGSESMRSEIVGMACPGNGMGASH